MIVVAGEALIDLIVPPDGRLTAVPGGGPFNTARTIGRLGGEVAFLGRLSSDRFGARLRDLLARDGVDLSMASATDLPTTLAIAELDAAGAATYRFHTARTSAPGLTEAEVVLAIGSGPVAFHLGTLGIVLEPMAGALASGLRAAAPGTLVMLDANCRPTAIEDRAAYLARLGAILARADVVKASVDDLAYIAPGVDPVEAAGRLVQRGPRIVLVTDGAQSVIVVAADRARPLATRHLEVPVPVVPVVDTVGAGDAFGGAFLARLVELGLGRAHLEDLDAVHDAASFAVGVASLTCRRAGAEPPWRAELEGRTGGR